MEAGERLRERGTEREKHWGRERQTDTERRQRQRNRDRLTQGERRRDYDRKWTGLSTDWGERDRQTDRQTDRDRNRVDEGVKRAVSSVLDLSVPRPAL